jgi:hypothetical protein
MPLDERKRRRRGGPAKLAPDDKRAHTVSVRLNVEELVQLDALRTPVAMQRGEYLRAAALYSVPASIPAVNREAYAALARAAANLNQITMRLHQAGQGEAVNPQALAHLKATLTAFRQALVGARLPEEP